MQVGKYEFVNEVKAADAVKEVGEKNQAKLLAVYDRRGGLIREEVKVDGVRTFVPVPLGTFWDFTKGEARKTPLKDRPKAVVKKRR